MSRVLGLIRLVRVAGGLSAPGIGGYNQQEPLDAPSKLLTRARDVSASGSLSRQIQLLLCLSSPSQQLRLIMVHYIRFMSPPRVSVGPKKTLDIHAVLALTTDLYDSFFPEDILLHVRVVGETENTRSLVQQDFTWKAQARVLKFSVQCSTKFASEKVRIHVAASQRAIPSNTLLSPLLDVWSAAFELTDEKRARSMVMRRIELPHVPPVCIWEEIGESMARHVWDASLGFLLYFNQNIGIEPAKRTQFCQKVFKRTNSSRPLQVIELGAGCGFVGIAMAQTVASNVLLTDLKDASSILAYNIENATPLPVSSLRAEVLDWEEKASDSFTTKYDVLLVSDCIYNPDSTPHLVDCLHRLTRKSPNAMILIGFKRRHTADDLFFQLMQQRKFEVIETSNINTPHITSEYDTSIPTIEFYTYRPPP